MSTMTILSADTSTASQYLLLEVQSFSAKRDGSEMVHDQWDQRYACWARMNARQVIQMYFEDLKKEVFDDGLVNVHYRTDPKVAKGRLIATDPVDDVEYVVHVKLYIDK